MKRKICLFCIMITAFLSGCANMESKKDTYIEGWDHQYGYVDYGNYFPRQAKGEKGYYLLNGSYIYYLDDEQKTVLPLCNKADCLHTMESEEEKYKQCNAYVENDGMVGIAYCNHYLYYIVWEYQESSGKRSYVLNRLKEDGSAKETMKIWDADTTIYQWIVHRGNLYYIQSAYTINEEKESIQTFQVKSLPLSGKLKQEQLIYEPETNLYPFNVTWPQAYGNHLYFHVLAYTVESKKVTEENFTDYLYLKTLEYNLQDKTIHDIYVGEGEYVQGVTFWQNKIVFTSWNFDKTYGDTGASYIADLDGSHLEPYIENVRQGECLYSDGTYLYVSNKMFLADSGEDEEAIYKVYDKDKVLIDTMRLPAQGNGELIFGDDKYMIVPIKDSEEHYSIKYMDKSTIGSYQGKAFHLENMAELDRAKCDIQKDE